MRPEKRFYPRQDQPSTEVVIYSTIAEDLYIILAGWDDNGATIKAYINPLVRWIWIGGFVIILGTAIAIAPDNTLRRLSGRRVGRELEERIS